jgi:hypothetical protein
VISCDIAMNDSPITSTSLPLMVVVLPGVPVGTAVGAGVAFEQFNSVISPT